MIVSKPIDIRFTDKVLYALTLLVIFAPTAHAGYLQINSTIETVTDEESQSILFEVKIENLGNQSSHEISIEFVDMGKSFTIAEKIEPKQSAELSLSLSFEELGIFQTGRVYIPTRIHYKDIYFYSFSSPHLIRVLRNPMSAEKLVTTFKGHIGPARINLRGEHTLHAVVTNLTHDRLSAKIKTVSPDEISFQLAETELSLGPRERRDVEIEIQNLKSPLDSTNNAFVITEVVENGIRMDAVSYCQITVFPELSRARHVAFATITILLLVGFMYTRRKLS